MEVYTTDIVGRTRMKFTESVDMMRIEKDIEMMFNPLVQEANYFYDEKNITLKEITYHNFNVTN